MSSISQQQRNEKILSLIDASGETYADADVKEQLGEQTSDLLQTYLSRIALAEVIDGVVYIPESDDFDSKIPVVALRKGEKVRMSEQFLVQTTAQRANTVDIVSGWDPLNASAQEYSDSLADSVESNGGEQNLSMAKGTSAYVSHPQAQFAASFDKFRNLPSGLAVYVGRPVLAVSLDYKVEPDHLAHELIHIKQRTETPIMVFNSQESVDVKILRDELEGYHIGALVRIGMEGGVAPRIPYRIPDHQIGRLLQVAINNIREKNNAGQNDPYRASPILLRKIAQSIGTSIIHHEFDYDDTYATITSLADFDIR